MVVTLPAVVSTVNQAKQHAVSVIKVRTILIIMIIIMTIIIMTIIRLIITIITITITITIK